MVLRTAGGTGRSAGAQTQPRALKPMSCHDAGTSLPCRQPSTNAIICCATVTEAAKTRLVFIEHKGFYTMKGTLDTDA